MLAKLLFCLRVRFAVGARVSLRCDVSHPHKIAIGRKTKVHARATLDASSEGAIRLGAGVTINRYAFVQGSRGGVTVGDRSEINNYSVVNGAGGVTIGTDVLIGPGVKLISYEHVFDDPAQPIRTQGYRYAPIAIGDDCWIGAGAIVLAGVEVGAGSVVAAGSVVTRSCPPRSVLLGAPARVVQQRGAAGPA